ncbi:hypothetical protein L1F30_08545 [Simiduia sp. 21SJ11W-1]|uniref:hypothetical protein n=1 Tax=Simiduia sp. 21SJ11W-1 TaxID=2909669 RepID=UPI00209C7E9E|nr:hypothetical protein [Simiduia sp. 21SJ11W-1]UTA49569.1 hypothetical protein L1F30_08545 [Simiduia sp. 21SJ11W-1]
MTDDKLPIDIEGQRQQRAFQAFTQSLPEAVEVDDALRARLAAMRADALAKATGNKRPALLPWAAAASVLVMLSWVAFQGSNTAPAFEPELALVTELENPDVDMELIDDLEFYEWLSELEG